MTADSALDRVLTPVPPTKPSSVKRLGELERQMPARADLILLGDSLAAGWPADLYGAAFPGRHVFNFGLPGDRVQNTLWRLETVELGHLRPRELVLLLGTNNLGDGDPPHAIADGVVSVLRRAAALWDAPRTLLVSVPWRGEPPGFREPDRLALNAKLAAELHALPRSSLIDADLALADADGQARSLDPDLLHLSRAGYARLSAAASLVLT